MPESRDPDASPLDWAGAALVTAGLACLTWAAIGAGERVGWVSVAASLAGFAIVAGFLWHEHRTAHPMLPLSMFRSISFVGANGTTVLLYAALGGALFVLPFVLMRVRGMSPAAAGASFLPFSLLVGVLSRPAGALVRRVGARLPLVVGPLIVAGGFVLLARSADPAVPYVSSVFGAMLAMGLGMAAAIPPLTTLALDSVPDHMSGTASGVNNAAARIAGLLAVAILGAVVLRDQAIRLDHAFPGARAAGFAEATDAASRGAVLAAFGLAARDAMLACGVLALAASGLAAATIGRPSNTSLTRTPSRARP